MAALLRYATPSRAILRTYQSRGSCALTHSYHALGCHCSHRLSPRSASPLLPAWRQICCPRCSCRPSPGRVQSPSYRLCSFANRPRYSCSPTSVPSTRRRLQTWPCIATPGEFTAPGPVYSMYDCARWCALCTLCRAQFRSQHKAEHPAHPPPNRQTLASTAGTACPWV